jgi:nicotinic acid mononucleotide adenylyltransferase
MCRLAFQKLSLPIRILDIERTLGGVSYTVRTINKLREQNPHERMFLVTGDDVRDQQGQWHDFDKIKDLVELIRVPRGPKSPIPDVSSTQIRERLTMKEPIAELVEREVAVYVVTKGLFR